MATLYENLLGGAISDDPLTSGATTINSSAFADLPAVAGSDVMFLTLDPAGESGAPEIVKVTAHTSSATSVTVARAQQDTASRSHPTATKWTHALTESDVDEFLKEVGTGAIVDAAVTTAKLAAAVTDRLPQAGDLKWTLDTSESGAWKNHNQTLAGADVAHPALWAKAPASWKSGSDLVIPDLSDVAMIGAGSVASLGALGGSNTATLTTGELPAHTHTGPSHAHDIGHGHSASSANTDLEHTHSNSHDHPSFNTATYGGTHIHTGDYANFSVSPSAGGYELGRPDYRTSPTPTEYNSTADGAQGGHNHAINVPSYVGVTGPGLGDHDHTVTVAGHTGDSGAAGTGGTSSTGSGDSFSIVARSLGVNVQVLAY